MSFSPDRVSDIRRYCVPGAKPADVGFYFLSFSLSDMLAMTWIVAHCATEKHVCASSMPRNIRLNPSAKVAMRRNMEMSICRVKR